MGSTALDMGSINGVAVHIEAPGRQSAVPPADPPGRWRALALMCTSMVCCLSPWFAATVGLAELKREWGLDDVAGSLLTVTVQLGFLFGSSASALLAVADVVPPRRLLCAGGLTAAAANSLLLVPSLSFAGACVLRFATGVAMAFVYPPGMKAASTWFRRGRGLGLGAMVGALSVGSALPHVIVGAPLQTVIIGTSAASASGAVIIMLGRDGPFPFKGVSRFQCALLLRVGRSRGTMLSAFAYASHMWELQPARGLKVRRPLELGGRPGGKPGAPCVDYPTNGPSFHLPTPLLLVII